MRLIKAAVKATFPNFTSAPLASTQAQIDLATSQAQGLSAEVIPLGTAALPGLAFLGNPNTGIFSPATNQIALSLNGAQVLLMGGTALVTSLGVAAAAFTTTGAYSGGTGQLVPIGAVLEWYDDVLPVEGGYCWANGQIIASANTVCPTLLARWGTKFGGNGVTTMGVPDRRDTVGIGKSTMGGVTSRGLQTLTNTVLGALIGAANVVLSIANLPPITSSSVQTITVNGPNGHTVVSDASIVSDPGTGGGGAHWSGGAATSSLSFSALNTLVVTSNSTTSTAVNNVQPSTTCNYIIRLG